VLEASPDYWGGKPDFDRMVVRAVPETAPRSGALLKGEVDMITRSPDHGDKVAGNPSIRVAAALYAGLYVLAVNSKVPPLNKSPGQAGPAARHRPRHHREESRDQLPISTEQALTGTPPPPSPQGQRGQEPHRTSSTRCAAR
jgi:ABC-type transport system substrate-binding protein